MEWCVPNAAHRSTALVLYTRRMARLPRTDRESCRSPGVKRISRVATSDVVSFPSAAQIAAEGLRQSVLLPIFCSIVSK
jgi:hypothetical protein